MVLLLVFAHTLADANQGTRMLTASKRCDLYPPASFTSYGVYQFGQAATSKIDSAIGGSFVDRERTLMKANTSGVLCDSTFVCREPMSFRNLPGRRLSSTDVMMSLTLAKSLEGIKGVCEKCPINSWCREGTTMPLGEPNWYIDFSYSLLAYLMLFLGFYVLLVTSARMT